MNQHKRIQKIRKKRSDFIHSNLCSATLDTLETLGICNVHKFAFSGLLKRNLIETEKICGDVRLVWRWSKSPHIFKKQNSEIEKNLNWKFISRRIPLCNRIEKHSDWTHSLLVEVACIYCVFWQLRIDWHTAHLSFFCSVLTDVRSSVMVCAGIHHP